MKYEEPLLVDLEDLEEVSGGSCNTGGSGSCDGDQTIDIPMLP